MMRVLIVYHAGAMIGARQIFRELADVKGMELTVVVPEKLKVDRVYDSSGWLCVEKEECADGYRMVPLPLRDLSHYWKGFESKPLRRFIRKIQPDITHVFDEPMSGYIFQVVQACLFGCRRSKVLFYGFENVPFHLRIRSRLKWKLKWALMSGGVAANSEALENVKRAGFPSGRLLERIFWGVSTQTFKPMDGARLKTRLGLDYERIVGFVGRLVPEKGLLVLLAALRRLPENVHCLIIGSGPMRAELEMWSGLPELLGRIHFYDIMGSDMLARYMNCMDVLAVPSLTTASWKEQYGRVIVEAMACGVPVVGSDSGAIPEVIDSAGLIVPEGDVSSFVEALNTAIFDSEAHDRFRQRGLQRVDQELSVRAMADKLSSFYGRVLAN